MRGTDEQQSDVFSYLSHEKRVPKDHPLRDIRTMVTKSWSGCRDGLTACTLL
jgi:hypothetical protein